MKFLIFCLFLISVVFSVNCITRHDAATWTGTVVIQETTGEWAAEPEEYSSRIDGGICDQVSGYWAIANVHNDGEETAGGPVICTPESRAIPIGEHSLPDHILNPGECPEGYHQGSIFDATVFFDSNSVGVGRTFKAYFYNPRTAYAPEEVIVSPNLANAKYGYELEFFKEDVFFENPESDQAVTDILCVRDDAKFTFGWGGHGTFSTRSDKNQVCADSLNPNYRAATASELSANIKSFFSYQDIKEYAQGFASNGPFVAGGKEPQDPPAFSPDNANDFRGIANGIVVADDACRTYLPTYGQWQITPECNEITNTNNCVCRSGWGPVDGDMCEDNRNCSTNAGTENYASSRWNPVVPEFEEITVPILSVHDNRYSRVIWRNVVRCNQNGINAIYQDPQGGCVHPDTEQQQILYGCEATQIGAQATDDTRVIVPVACIWDPYHSVGSAGIDFDENECPAPVDYVHPTWSYSRGWFRPSLP